MKEQWSISENNIDPVILEEGLYQKKQKCVKKTNCCVRCIPYLRLIFLLEVTLFFGWGCYMILQTYLPQVNETTSVTFEKNHLPIEYETEIQQLRPTTEIPATFEVIDKIHNILKDMIKTDQNLTQKKAIVTDGVSMALTSTQNSNNVQNNYTEGLSVINSLLTLYESLLHEKVTISSMREKSSSIESTDENVSTYEKNQSFRHVQFLEKLRNISKAANDLKKSENRSDFGEDVDPTLKSQENHSLLNKLESLDFNAATISNRENFPEDPTTSVDSTNTLPELRQKFATQEHRDLVMCPPSESHESSDTSMNDSDKGSSTSTSTSQRVLAQEISKQVENKSSDDVDERNKDKHDVNDSDISTPASGFKDHFGKFELFRLFDTSMATVRDTEKQYSSESIAKIIGDEKSIEITENPYKLWSVPQSTVQDSVEFSTPNVDKFEWFNGFPSSADFKRLEWKDILKSITEQSLSSENMRILDEIIPESQCKITIETGILEVNCPAVKFNEKWNFASFEPPTNVNFPLTFLNFRDIHYMLNFMCGEDASEQLGNENISNENSDKEVTRPRDSVPKIINTIDLQESTTSAEILNDALPDLFDASFMDSYEMGDEYEDYDYRYKRDISENFSEFYPNYLEDKDKFEQVMPNSFSKFRAQIIDLKKGQHPFLDMIIQQQKQLKINEEQNLSVNNNTEFLKAYDDLNKKLTSLLKNEMLNVTTRYLLKWTTSDFNKWNICSILPYIRFTHQTHTWREHFFALRKLWEDNKKIDVAMYPNYSHNMKDNHRKKRMIDDLNRQQDQISNTLEEDDKDMDLLIEKLKEIFLKMEILTLCIDRLHERYLLHNKLDDDYASSEFPIKTEERRELYTLRNVYEK